jgi:hypothetical protein
MSGPFILIATSKIRDGKLDDERQRVPGSMRFIADSEPRAIGYHEYCNAEGTEVELIEIHPDAASFEHHMRVAEPSFRETLEKTLSIRVYGQPTEHILELLGQAAGADATVTVFPEHLGGFTRGPDAS